MSYATTSRSGEEESGSKSQLSEFQWEAQLRGALKELRLMPGSKVKSEIRAEDRSMRGRCGKRSLIVEQIC